MNCYQNDSNSKQIEAFEKLSRLKVGALFMIETFYYYYYNMYKRGGKIWKFGKIYKAMKDYIKSVI